jgi:integrase
MIFVARMTGMRIGELRALAWDQIDLAHLTVRIDRAVWRDRMALPKHDRVRTISISNSTADRLATHRATPLGQHALVFPKADGAMRGQQRCGNALREIGTKAGTGPIGWHVLRHTFATTLVAAGVNLRAVQDLMGHANLSTTMRYAHLLPDSRATALRALDAFIDRGHHSGNGADDSSAEGDD